MAGDKLKTAEALVWDRLFLQHHEGLTLDLKDAILEVTDFLTDAKEQLQEDFGIKRYLDTVERLRVMRQSLR